MITDKRTIRTAIFRRIPEVYNVALLPGKSHIHIFILAKIKDALGRDYFISIEENEMPYQGTHNDLMNVVDRLYDEVQKYKKTQKDLEEASGLVLNKLAKNDEDLKLTKPKAPKIEKEVKLDSLDKLTTLKAEEERVKNVRA